jgi:hypothetical protein
MDGNWYPPWVIRAETQMILACEEFTLLCQDDGQVALQTCHKTGDGNSRVVTAMGLDRNWLLIGETDVIDSFEKFTLLDAVTREPRRCLEVIDALKKDREVEVAFQTYHMKDDKHRLVTAMDIDWDWVLRAETNELGPSEMFTMTLLY